MTEQTNELIPENLGFDDFTIEEALEAILFAAGHAVAYTTLARVFNTTPGKIKSRVFDYAVKYNAQSEGLARGVILLAYPDECQLCTKEAFLPQIREALGVRKSGSLSTASMETLAVVAYNQPVTRVFVDAIRKVDSSYAMNSLIDRGLIECVGRLDVPGRPMQYGTTSDFLRCFGIDSINDLPPTSEELLDIFQKTKLETEPNDIGENQLSMDLGEEIPTEEAEGIHNDSPDTEPSEASESYEEHSAEDDFIDVE